MPIGPKFAIKDLYEVLPDSETKAGDIWEGLPTLGLLHQKSARGIVITPACDLSNNKSETVTYLPVVPVGTWLLSRAARPEHFRAMRGQLQAAGLKIPDWLDPSANGEVCTEDCTALHRILEELGSHDRSPKRIEAASRAKAGARILLGQCSYAPASVTMRDLEILLGERALVDTISAIVRNSYRSDVHFLPEDGQEFPVSAMPESTLALFRYPLTLPIEIFRAASDVLRPDWVTEVSRIAPQFPAAILATTVRPLKVSRLRPRFFADLVARFIALHVRLGTPDFTEDTVNGLVNFIKKRV